MAEWVVSVNGTRYKPIKAVHSWTAVMRALRAYVEDYPKTERKSKYRTEEDIQYFRSPDFEIFVMRVS